MNKRCRRCIHRETMKSLLKHWSPDWTADTKSACFSCRRFPRIRKMHPDNFKEKDG